MQTFTITIERGAAEDWPVVVEHETDDTPLPDRHEGALRLAPKTRAALDAAAFDPTAYGAILGQALFQGSVRDAFMGAVRAAPGPLRMLLTVEDKALRGLRWERLCAPTGPTSWGHLALNQRLPFSLSIPSLAGRRFPPIGRRDLRALILVASPAGEPAFDVAASVEAARVSLGHIPADVLARVPGGGPPTLDALMEALTAGGHTMLHVVCHGAVRNGAPALFLEQADGTVDRVPDARLLERLQTLRRPPYFAFLSACESSASEAEDALGGLAQRLVRELGMPAVVAMTDRVTVATATDLTRTFYARLREHGEPDLALVEATAGLAERGDILVPALFCRPAAIPLFDTAARPVSALTAAEIGDGLDRFAAALPTRAPTLAPVLAGHDQTLRPILGTDPAELAEDARRARADALDAVAVLCQEVLEISFSALAIGQDPPTYDARPPFRGRHPFRPEDRDLFFGRDAATEALRQKLEAHPLVAVVGPSGCGKSSLVLAGLLPALERAEPGLRWAEFSPGPAPGEALDAALQALPDPRGVLVVDRFETLFLCCPDPTEQAAFGARLLREAGARRVIVTLRTGFAAECAALPGLGSAILDHAHTLPPMTTAGLRAAIEQQSRQVNLKLEADLAATILHDVDGEPGAMALLQHVLLDLWERRRGRWLRARDYREAGGAAGAAIAIAEALFRGFTQSERTQARDIMMRLTRLDADAAPGAAARDRRRPAALEDLAPAGADPQATIALAHRLADAGLVVIS